LGRLSPSQAPRKAKGGLERGFLVFFGPLTQAEARSEGEGQARSGGAGTPAFAPGTRTSLGRTF
jgi:hypothetical protein